MKSLLLHASGDPAMDGRLQVAFDLVRAFEAHLTCLQATPLEPCLDADPFGNVRLVRSKLEAMHGLGREVRTRIEARLRAEAVNWDWVSEDGGVAETIVRHAGLADLVILSGDASPAEARVARVLVGEVALSARAPVLSVPGGTRSLDCFGAAVVAWNGSPEAASALRFSLPLLKLARAVHIVTVSEDRTGFPAVDASQYLARHGIGSELHECPLTGDAVADSLRDAAARLGAAYVVMGAYGHSRFRETVFGGVTRSLLDESKLPLLLAH